MRFATGGTLAACVCAATAFKNTSPFFLFSTSPISQDFTPSSSSQIQSASALTKSTIQFLSTCPSQAYLLITQPSVTPADYASSRAIPLFKLWMSNSTWPQLSLSVDVREVVGSVDTEAVTESLLKCGGRLISIGMESVDKEYEEIQSAIQGVVVPWITALPNGDARVEALAQTDSFLNDIMLNFPESMTVIYTTTPQDKAHEPYVPEFQQPLNVELKRDTSSHSTRANNRTSNSTVPANAPLFQKYQFLTPGLFMSITVAIILFSMLGVAISALGSLSVSYAAFDKEMGPAAQKKAQ